MTYKRRLRPSRHACAVDLDLRNLHCNVGNFRIDLGLDCIYTDYAGPFIGKMIVVVTDAYSKWVDTHIKSGFTSAITIDKLRQSFSTRGIPDVIASDKATGFVSEEYQDFCRHNGIKAPGRFLTYKVGGNAPPALSIAPLVKPTCPPPMRAPILLNKPLVLM